MTITWRDVNAPNQSAALGFAQTGANQIGRSIDTVTQLASNIAGQELADFNRQREQNTSSLLQRINEIGDLDTFNETSGSDEFSVDNLRSTFGDAVDISAVQQGLSNRRNALTQLRDQNETRANTEALRGVDNIYATQGIDAALKAVETNKDILDKTGAKTALYGLQEQNQLRTNQLKQKNIDSIINAAAFDVQANPDNFDEIRDRAIQRLEAAGATSDQVVSGVDSIGRMQILRNASSPIAARRAEAVLGQEIVNTERELSQMEEDLRLYEANNPYSDTRWTERNSEEITDVYKLINEVAPYQDFIWRTEGIGGSQAREKVDKLVQSYAIFAGNEEGDQVYRLAKPEEIKKYSENERKKEEWAELTRADKLPKRDTEEYNKKVPDFNMPTLARIQPWHIKNSLHGSLEGAPQNERGHGWFTGNTEIMENTLTDIVARLAVESAEERYKTISTSAQRKRAIRDKQAQLDNLRSTSQYNIGTTGADRLRGAAK